ncbi:MAG: glycosyltransferase family 87 protein [Bacteroidota bacterium]
MRWRESARAACREVGWPLGIPAVLAGAWLLAMPVYLATIFYAHALAHPEVFVYDYAFFRFAAERFAHTPLALYADPEYLYPPPAVLAFLPATWTSQPVGYIASGPLIAGGLGVAYLWAVRLWEETDGTASVPASVPGQSVPRRTLSPAVRAALLIVALGSGPTFQTLKYAQVNGWMLLSALAFVHLVQRGRPGWGALALIGGFWLKLLPLALLPLGLGRRWPRLAMGALAGLVALPLVLLPVVPWELYREYALERLPAISGMTDLGALSGSLQASLTRLEYPIEVIIRGGMVEASPLARVAGAMVGAGVLGVTTLAAWTRRIGTVRAGFVVLAVLPVAIPLGWEHTYVLALPLLLVALAEAGDRPVAVRGLVMLAALAFFAQRLPPPQTAALVDALPRAVLDLYAARLWLATLGLIGLGLAPALRSPRLGTEAALRPSPGASSVPGLRSRIHGAD